MLPAELLHINVCLGILQHRDDLFLRVPNKLQIFR